VDHFEFKVIAGRIELL